MLRKGHHLKLPGRQAAIHLITIQKAVLLPGDIGDRECCEQVASDAISKLGGIDILVNNAAYQRSYEKFEDIPDEEFVLASKEASYVSGEVYGATGGRMPL